MSVCPTTMIRVTGIRSQNPRGFGGAIFTGVPVDADGSVLDACTYVVVKANRHVIAGVKVERGQWWQVSGSITQRPTPVDAFVLVEQQIEAETALLALPSGEHIITFIAENPVFEGIGSVKARRLWERFGERLYDILDAADASAFDGVLTTAAAQTLVAGWTSNAHSRTLQWLQAQGFEIGVGRKVLRFFGDEAETRIKEDPYRLLSFMGKWADVDRMARDLFSVNPEDSRRLRGAVEEACYRMFSEGHTAMLSADLIERVRPLLGRPSTGVRWRDILATSIAEGLSNGSFVKTLHGLQPLGAWVLERTVAKAIHERLTAARQRRLMDRHSVDRAVAAVEAANEIELNPEQRHAIQLAMDHAFICITGGAGVGKTTVLKSLYLLYEAAGVKVLQVALAGRAAKRMTEATGLPASTIASFLKANADLTFDGPTVLVVDEASMVDIISMARLCELVPPHVRLVLVGDPHQLMPVGPGLVLHSIMQVPDIPSSELKSVKRFGGEIAAFAASVRAGIWPSALSAEETAAVCFIPCEERLIGELIAELYALDFQGTQVLSPLRNGPAGTKTLNQLCQEKFTNGNARVTYWNEEFETAQGCGFSLGDVLLCTRNLWGKGLQNGSLGRVVEVEPCPREAPSQGGLEQVLAWVDWDDGIRRAVTLDMLGDLELGYAVTVHKAQGSQWPRIIVPVTASKLLDRTLLYTAMTRAQKQVLLIGDIDVARHAVEASPRPQARKVALDLTLKQLLHRGDAQTALSNVTRPLS